MRSCILNASIFCALAACGDNLAAPVDAKFNAKISGDGVPAGSVVSVDVYWLGDGSVDVRFDDVNGVIPGPDELKGVVLQESNHVLSEGSVPIVRGGEIHKIRLEGSIDPDALDLTFTDTPPGGTAAMVKLKGEARPFGSVDTLDGEYLLAVDHYPAKCPGTDRPPIPQGNVLLDVLADGAGARLKLYDELVFTVPVTDGAVAWTGEMKDVLYQASFQVTAAGTLAPDDTELTLDVPDPASGVGCVDRLVLTGAKRLPDAAVVDGDYRADIVWDDGCAKTKGAFSSPVKLLAQDEGKFVFTEFDGSTMEFSMTAGQPYHGHFVDVFGSGADILYDGVSDAPNLSYDASYTYPFSDAPCTIALHATAYKRYFFPTGAE